jgi:hypothetical protein
MTTRRIRRTVAASALASAVAVTAAGPAFSVWASESPGTGYASAVRLPAPAAPTATAGGGGSVTVSWPQVLLAPQAPATGYRLARYHAGTGAEAPVGAGCAGVVTALTCTESAVPDGTWRYAVRALFGPRWTGPQGPRGSQVGVFSIAVTGPADGQTYGRSAYAAACAAGAGICGTVTGAPVTGVTVSVRRAGGAYWDPATGGFTSQAEKPMAATGTSSWRLPFPVDSFPADGQYVVRAVATDGATSATDTNAFTLDVTAPTATDVQATNDGGGQSGRAESGDRLTFTFSEPIAPGSVLPGWTGTARAGSVRLVGGATGTTTLTVGDGDGAALTALGTVVVGDDYVAAGRTVTLPATLAVVGSTVRVTLGGTHADIRRGGAGDMRWTPGGVTDPEGNVVGNAGQPVTEARSGSADREF